MRLRLPGFCPVAAAVSVLLALCPLTVQSAPLVPLKVTVNTEARGDLFGVITGDGDVLLTPADLASLGIATTIVPAGTPTDQPISLRGLGPQVTFKFDPKKALLALTADPTLLKPQTLELAEAPPKGMLSPRDNSAYLNYSAVYGLDSRNNFASLTMPFETAMRLGGTLAYSSFLHSQTPEQQLTVRMLSNLSWDAPETRRRIMLGDVNAASGRLGGSALLGGLRVATEASLTPYFSPAPGLNVTGLLETPSDLDIYVNDILVRHQHFSAGPIELQDVPFAQGAGDVTLVIHDAYGREQRIVAPFYIASNLLRAGLQEYSYSAGYVRTELGTKSGDYGDPAALFFHRYGFSDALTLGLRGEVAQSLRDFGLTGNARLWRLGELQAGVSESETDGERGRGSYFGYSYASPHLSVNLFAQTQSRHYANVSLGADQDKLRFYTTSAIGIPIKSLGNFSLVRIRQDNYASPDRISDILFYSLKIGNHLSLFAQASHVRTIQLGSVDKSNEALVGLLLTFGTDYSAGMSYTNRDANSSESVYVQKNAPVGPGWGYRVEADRNEEATPGEQWSGNANVQYNGQRGVYSVQRIQSPNTSSTNFTVAGSLAYVGGSTWLSRPITDAFALVKVDELPDVRVYASNQEMGRTNAEGEALVPNLIAYFGNNLSIEQQDVPFDYKIGGTRLTVAPPYRGGVMVPFDVQRVQAFTAHLYFRTKAGDEAASLAGLSLEINGEAKEFVVGKGGLFYAEQLRPGTYPARLYTEKRSCEFDLVIPRSTERMVDLGKVYCESH
jgi:outer membrane usher protein